MPFLPFFYSRIYFAIKPLPSVRNLIERFSQQMRVGSDFSLQHLDKEESQSSSYPLLSSLMTFHLPISSFINSKNQHPLCLGYLLRNCAQKEYMKTMKNFSPACLFLLEFQRSPTVHSLSSLSSLFRCGVIVLIKTQLQLTET